MAVTNATRPRSSGSHVETPHCLVLTTCLTWLVRCVQVMRVEVMSVQVMSVQVMAMRMMAMRVMAMRLMARRVMAMRVVSSNRGPKVVPSQYLGQQQAQGRQV